MFKAKAPAKIIVPINGRGRQAVNAISLRQYYFPRNAAGGCEFRRT